MVSVDAHAIKRMSKKIAVIVMVTFLIFNSAEFGFGIVDCGMLNHRAASRAFAMPLKLISTKTWILTKDMFINIMAHYQSQK
jgi:hypothetical protein